MRGMFNDEEKLFSKVRFPIKEEMAIKYRAMLAARWLTIHGLRAFSRNNRVISRNSRFHIVWHQADRVWVVLIPFNMPDPEEHVFTDFNEVTAFLLEDRKHVDRMFA